MFAKDKNRFDCQMEEKYSQIIEIIKESAPLPPPADFTRKVMARLAGVEPVAAGSSIRLFLTGLQDDFKSLRFARKISGAECSFYFFLTGVFYLVLGAVLMAGFVDAAAAMTGWLKFQPWIALLNSLLFLALGFSLGREGAQALRAVKPGILFFIVLTLINGVFTQIFLNIPLAITLGLIVTNAMMGLLLLLAAQKTDWSARSGNGLEKTAHAHMGGFTMLEVIAVVLIIGIIGAIVVSRATSTSTFSLKSQADVIRTHLRYAQTRSMNTSSVYGLIFGNATTYSLFYDGDTAKKWTLVGEDGQEVNLASKTPGMTILTETPITVAFDSIGRPCTDQAGTTLQSVNRTITLSFAGETETITITKNTGFIP